MLSLAVLSHNHPQTEAQCGEKFSFGGERKVQKAKSVSSKEFSTQENSRICRFSIYIYKYIKATAIDCLLGGKRKKYATNAT